MPLFLILTIFPVNLTALTVDLTTVPIVEEKKEWTQEGMKKYALEIATEYGLNKQRFLKVIENESQWNICAKGDYENGEPTSFGLAQLHYPLAHWGVTKEEACDPEIALPIMANAWVNGKASKWTAWRTLYGVDQL